MKNRFSVNQNNQLTIRASRRDKNIIPRGSFSVDRNNRLIYQLNESPAWRKLHNLPSRITFVGKWSLDANHDLELILSESKDQFKGDKLTLKGLIIAAEGNSIVFEIVSQQGLHPEACLPAGRGTVPVWNISLLKLTGIWQADESNRLIFSLTKKSSPETLILSGAWQLNNNQQISYSYEKIILKRKIKSIQSFAFEGFWQIDCAKRIVYIFERSSSSRFAFRAQIESPNLLPKEGVIKYRLGAGLRQVNSSAPQIICFYGEWKFERNLGLSFEMDYGEGRVHKLQFGASVRLSDKDKVTLSLTNNSREQLGISITFTRKLLKEQGAEAFLRLKNSSRESAVEAGVNIPF